MSEYARYFKQELLSDCDLVISWPDTAVPPDPLGFDSTYCHAYTCEEGEQYEDRGHEATNGVYSFPAHQLVLNQSSHFEAQVRSLYETLHVAAGANHLASGYVACKIRM